MGGRLAISVPIFMVLLIVSAADNAGHSRKVSISPAASPLSPLTSGSGGNGNGPPDPLKGGPLPPHLRGEKGAANDQLRLESVRAVEDERLSAMDSLQVTSILAPSQAPESSAQSTPPAPGTIDGSPPSHTPRITIRGRVTCERCSTKHKAKTHGLSGVSVELSCPQANLTMVTQHHGQFSMGFHHLEPLGFPGSCAVSVITSSLPSTCNVPVGSATNSFTPTLHSTSSKETAYVVPAFEFTNGDNCK
ncbi:hypothetical protein SELMODRAFT_443961 [Selaginella moellendorffii]|uniref:Uncharacterized protein n=1 Tax=Selaginella moellendorffii TaxID=88036 RepID=D8S5V6_SELML|nr:hypothetical protein SELMODRAFT_443961 [Selaginella moellendorffii]